MNASLKIHRVNKSRFQVKDGKKVIRECSSFKEAMNAIIAEDMILLDNVEDFCESEYMDDLDLIELIRAA